MTPQALRWAKSQRTQCCFINTAQTLSGDQGKFSREGGAIVKQEWALIPSRSGLHFFIAVWFPANLLPIAFIIKDNKPSQALDEKVNTKDLS